MQTKIKSLPPGGCDQCGRVAQSAQLLGARCANRLPEGLCDGNYRATQAVSDWIQCPACKGDGSIDTQRCSHCDASGWVYARPRFP
jgi:DnaJ-class molecular chaperone